MKHSLRAVPCASGKWVDARIRGATSRQAALGRTVVRQEQAQGILVAALGVLAGHFGNEQVVPV
jgi:hypothetical protein